MEAIGSLEEADSQKLNNLNSEELQGITDLDEYRRLTAKAKFNIHMLELGYAGICEKCAVEMLRKRGIVNPYEGES